MTARGEASRDRTKCGMRPASARDAGENDDGRPWPVAAPGAKDLGRDAADRRLRPTRRSGESARGSAEHPPVVRRGSREWNAGLRDDTSEQRVSGHGNRE